MAFYIKANPIVARHLGLTELRNQVPDGNYMLWQADMMAFGSLTALDDTLARIGAVALTPVEARREQDGAEIRPLPRALDPLYVYPPETEETGKHEETEQPEETTETITPETSEQ